MPHTTDFLTFEIFVRISFFLCHCVLYRQARDARYTGIRKISRY